jgi:hypothetical protein
MNAIRSAGLAAFATWAVSAAPSAHAANDATPFGAFEAVCLTPNADFAGVKAAASAWRDTEVTGDSVLPGVTASDRLSKATKAGGVPVTLFAWTGTTKSGVHVSGCTVRVSKSDFDEFQSAAATYVGFAAQDAAPRKVTFRYTPAAAKPTAIDKSGFDAAAAGEGMDILTVTGDIHGAVLDLLKIKK